MHPFEQTTLVAWLGLIVFGLLYGAKFLATIILYCREFCQ